MKRASLNQTVLVKVARSNRASPVKIAPMNQASRMNGMCVLPQTIVRTHALHRQRPAATPFSDGHPTPILSLEKVTTVEQAATFAGLLDGATTVVELKLDGPAVRARYERGSGAGRDADSVA